MQTFIGYENPDKLYESPRSRIYRAHDEVKKQPVVLKIINKENAPPEEILKLNREYDMISRFQDTGIAQAYQLIEIDDAPAIAMKDIGGRNIVDILQTKKLTMNEFLQLGVQIADIIGNIHKHNIIHKDINPTNIIWNIETNEMQIIDFGIATELPREITSVKNPQILEGTPAYISPEQTGRMNRSVDYRTDFYSLGVTFYWMLTNRLPFETQDMLKLVHSHIAVVPATPHEIDNSIPEAISNIVMKLMAKNAEDRYLSAYGLKTDLEYCRQEIKEKGTVALFKLGMEDVSDKFQIPQKLYGREQELNLLMSAFQNVKQASTELMLVSGFSGIGKSFLVNEIHKPIVQHCGYFVSGKFEKLKKDVPYSALIQALTSLARQILAEDQIEINLWREKLSSVLTPNGKIITDLIPDFELIMGEQPDVSALGPVETQNRFNIVFQKFIKTLASQDHPLVVFMDDLQWADLASLQLMKLLLTDSDLKYLLIIGAYRHNETPDAHPLILTIDGIKKTGTTVNMIYLEPLEIDHVNQLLCDTLNRSKEDTTLFAQLLVQKTRGNPFSINQFLKTLYNENLICFSFEHGWSWQIENIKKMQSTDNIVGLLTDRINDLSENAQYMLKLAACIGNHFTFKSLALISEKSEKDILSALQILLHEGVIYKIDETYRFSHDRILEAVYSVIPEEEKVTQHYRIGKTELNTTATHDLPEKIFSIANHLNNGVSLITDVSEKRILAELNLNAGKKALASNAYASALNFLNSGIRLLGKNAWQDNYDFTLALHQEATVAAQLNANYDIMEKSADKVIEHGKTILDKVRVYEAKILAHMAKNQPLDATRTGLNVLRQLGLRMPEKPSMLKILFALIQTKLTLIGKPVEQLINQEEMKDPFKRASLQILAGTAPAMYTAAPEIVPLLNFNAIRTSMKYGRSDHSPFFYTTFGLIQAGFLGDIETGYKWAKLGQDLVEKYNISMTKAKVLATRWLFVNHMKMSLRDMPNELLEAYKAGIETGDLEMAALALMGYSLDNVFSGNTLTETERIIKKYGNMIKKLNQDTYLTYQHTMHQYVMNLMGKSDDPCVMIGSSYDQDKMIPIHMEANDRSALCTLLVYLCMLNYLFGNYEKALEYSEETKPCMIALTATPNEPVYFFFDSLIRIALIPFKKKSIQIKYLRMVRQNQKKMKKWAIHAPMNYSHKYHLVEAEKARVIGNERIARKQYAMALKGAHENRYLNEEALTLELTAGFWLGINEEKVASIYMEEAYQAYFTWGAIAKARQIEKRYRYLLKDKNKPFNPTQNTTTISTPTATGITTSTIFDLSTVMKTSQTLSSEIDLGKLLQAIMTFSIENAGAQRGFLIIENENNGQLCTEAESEEGKTVNVLNSIPIEERTDLSKRVVLYVNRTIESVILGNASEEGEFTEDPYIKANKIKSLLCMPITHKGKTTGILYMENNLAINTFTNDRLELLRIITSQAAISIDNARLLVHRENAAKLEKEMEIAANIQTSLIPEKPVIKGYDVSTFMMPADEVGGDYYDVINTGGRDWVVIGDVSGHGVRAGLIMMMTQTAIHAVLNQNPDLPPNDLLTIVNKTITTNIQQMNEDKYMTITVFALHENGRFIFSGLHQDIMIYRKKTRSVDLVRTDGLWLGIVDDIKNVLTVDQFDLDPGDVMLVYTDGITEAWEKNHQDSLFGDNRLQKILLESGEGHAHDIKDAILESLQNYTTMDDVTIVVLKRT